MRCLCCNKVMDVIEFPTQQEIDEGAEWLCNACDAAIFECANGYDDLEKGWVLMNAVEGEMPMMSDSDLNTSSEPITDNFCGGIDI